MNQRELEIQQTANEILRNAGAGENLPVDLTAIMTGHSFDYSEEEIEDMISSYVVSKGNKRHICLKSSLKDERKRFEAAHAIGHIFLHGDLEKSLFIEKQAYNRDSNSFVREIPEEVEANHFASCLLMPEQLVYDVVVKTKGPINESDIKTFAKKFNVTPMTMCLRLNRLGYINFFL